MAGNPEAFGVGGAEGRGGSGGAGGGRGKPHWSTFTRPLRNEDRPQLPHPTSVMDYGESRPLQLTEQEKSENAAALVDQKAFDTKFEEQKAAKKQADREAIPSGQGRAPKVETMHLAQFAANVEQLHRHLSDLHRELTASDFATGPSHKPIEGTAREIIDLAGASLSEAHRHLSAGKGYRFGSGVDEFGNQREQSEPDSKAHYKTAMGHLRDAQAALNSTVVAKAVGDTPIKSRPVSDEKISAMMGHARNLQTRVTKPYKSVFLGSRESGESVEVGSARFRELRKQAGEALESGDAAMAGPLEKMGTAASGKRKKSKVKQRELARAKAGLIKGETKSVKGGLYQDEETGKTKVTTDIGKEAVERLVRAPELDATDKPANDPRTVSDNSTPTTRIGAAKPGVTPVFDATSNVDEAPGTRAPRFREVRPFGPQTKEETERMTAPIGPKPKPAGWNSGDAERLTAEVIRGINSTPKAKKESVPQTPIKGTGKPKIDTVRAAAIKAEQEKAQNDIASGNTRVISVNGRPVKGKKGGKK